MTPEKKIYNAIRDYLISEDPKFLQLSKKDQDNIILAIFHTHIKNIKETD